MSISKPNTGQFVVKVVLLESVWPRFRYFRNEWLYRIGKDEVVTQAPQVIDQINKDGLKDKTVLINYRRNLDDVSLTTLLELVSQDSVVTHVLLVLKNSVLLIREDAYRELVVRLKSIED